MDDQKRQKRLDAFNLFYESVLKPDHELRQAAHEQLCYHELMEWRGDIIRYLDERRNFGSGTTESHRATSLESSGMFFIRHRYNCCWIFSW